MKNTFTATTSWFLPVVIAVVAAAAYTLVIARVYG